jgi:NAD+ synthase (glutamine-hydrolysing)
VRDGFVKVAAATPDIHVADPEYNSEKIIGLMQRSDAQHASVLVLPELCITGYTCGDLFLQRQLLAGAQAALGKILKASVGLDMLIAVGLPLPVHGSLYNVAAMVWNGAILGVVPKTNIPNYSEFYEKRYFTSANHLRCDHVTLCGQTVPIGTDLLFTHNAMPGLTVAAELCEDLWVPAPPSIRHATAGATVIVNLSASDETVAKDEYRRQLVSGQSARLVCGYIYTDAGAGESTQDVVYTGHNIIAENGAVLAESTVDSGLILSEIDVHRIDMERRRMGTFAGDSSGYRTVTWGGKPAMTDLTRKFSPTPFVPGDPNVRSQRCEKILSLQSMGLKKRLRHTNAKTVVVGVSGGLDSTLAMLVCARAMDMLGRPRTDIIAVTMPCFGTTKRTRSNAEILAEKLGATLRTVDITKAVNQHFQDIGHDPENLNVVYENSQARERTQVLMNIANEEGGLVIGTGDLSELALGWATYNGDHMSMYGVNGGVPKTLVRYLVAYEADICGDKDLREALLSILDTPVSPELLPAENGKISQKTEDLVGPYELHDFFLYYLIRWGFPPKKVLRLAEYAFDGAYDRETILKWLRTFIRRFFAQQFKRSCLPDGPKVGTLTLSPRGDWRMPSDAAADLWLKELENL